MDMMMLVDSGLLIQLISLVNLQSKEHSIIKPEL